MNGETFFGIALVAMIAACVLASSAYACSAIVVGRKASIDGSVLLGHNEQNGGQRFLNFRKIPRLRHKDGEVVRLRGGASVPQVKQTYAFLWSQNPGKGFSDGYMNEWGVSVVSNLCYPRKYDLRKLESRGQLVKGGIGYMLRRLVVERARTAREGIQVAGKLIEQVGYCGSQTLIIADPNEAWLMSMTPGKHWVARRVPDEKVVVLPNLYIIGEVNLKDKSNFLASPGLVEYATKRRWYSPTSGKPFNFYEAYSKPPKQLLDLRQWRGQCLVTGKKIKRRPDRRLPFAVKPARKIFVKDVITILRCHGEGGLCSNGTQEAAIFQLRSNMPPAIGCIYWRTSAEPCTSVLTPWYAGIKETPGEYYKPVTVKRQLTLKYHFSTSAVMFKPDRKHAWWVFRRLQEVVRRDYDNHVKIVRAAWDELELQTFAKQPSFEVEAQRLYRKDKSAGRTYLTARSRLLARNAIRKARELTKQLEQKSPDK